MAAKTGAERQRAWKARLVDRAERAEAESVRIRQLAVAYRATRDAEVQALRDQLSALQGATGSDGRECPGCGALRICSCCDMDPSCTH